VYQDYQGYVRKGGRASFTELLLTKGLIDRASFGTLERAVPVGGPIPAHLRGTQGSQSFKVPQPVADPWLAEAPSALKGGDSDRPAWADRTTEYDEVLQQPPPGWVGDKTMEFGGVLKAQSAEGQSTGVYDQVIPPPGSRYAKAPDTANTDTYDQVLGVPMRAKDRGAAGPRSPETRADPAGSGKRKPMGSGGRKQPMGSGGRKQPMGSGGRKQPFPSGGLPDLADSEYESDIIEPDSSDRLPVESEPKQGDTMGPYTIEKVLGRGGMGIIYRAQKPGSEQRVALKVLVGAQEPGEQSGRKRQRFRREFEALRRLEHPHIVAVHDYGRQDPFDWYAMDYVAGLDFEQILLRDRLDREAKLVVFKDVCLAMSHAHARHVIHRDLKPQNVIVDDLGRGHVLDFGLAKILDQGLQMTRTGSTLGTPFYISPEQLRSARDVDERADVFALGVILYEMLTGVRPFDGETAAEVGNKILTEDPVPPSRHDPTIHQDLDLICRRALEKDPDDRYEDAESLHADLLRHEQGLGVKRKSRLLAGTRCWVQRNKAGILGGLIASVILVPLILYLALRVARGGP
jgi:hypothetical protein